MVSESLFWDVMRVVQEVEELFFMILARNRARWKYWINRRLTMKYPLSQFAANSGSMYELPGGRVLYGS